jgi:ABC-2 type transport system ATP-binding protein
MSSPIIQTSSLTRRFRHTLAVDRLNLEVAQGSVFAFLGPNGAGKTTTIQMLMGIQHATAGESKVFGCPSHRLGKSEFQRIGYVSENQKLPEWMTVDGLMRYCGPLYPSWDQAFCETLLRNFHLPRDRKLKHLSRGMKMKAALISSLAYRPELLVLDEPFSGLDPLVRAEFIEGMLELTEQEKWTIFLSSHDIDEVERLADTVGIVNDGRLVLAEGIEALQARFRTVEVVTDREARVPDAAPESWLRAKAGLHNVRFVHSHYDGEASEKEIRERIAGVTSIEATGMSLKEIYLTLARGFVAETATSSAVA